MAFCPQSSCYQPCYEPYYSPCSYGPGYGYSGGMGCYNPYGSYDGSGYNYGRYGYGSGRYSYGSDRYGYGSGRYGYGSGSYGYGTSRLSPRSYGYHYTHRGSCYEPCGYRLGYGSRSFPPGIYPCGDPCRPY